MAVRLKSGCEVALVEPVGMAEMRYELREGSLVLGWLRIEGGGVYMTTRGPRAYAEEWHLLGEEWEEEYGGIGTVEELHAACWEAGRAAL